MSHFNVDHYQNYEGKPLVTIETRGRQVALDLTEALALAEALTRACAEALAEANRGAP